MKRGAHSRGVSGGPSPSPPWRGGPEPQDLRLLPRGLPHIEIRACSKSQAGACALAHAAECPVCPRPVFRLRARALLPRARRGSEPVEREGRGGESAERRWPA